LCEVAVALLIDVNQFNALGASTHIVVIKQHFRSLPGPPIDINQTLPAKGLQSPYAIFF
jgi:hypothetical protein